MKLFAVIGIWSRKISAVNDPRDVSKVAVGFAMAEALKTIVVGPRINR